jgi:hypothetical protein
MYHAREATAEEMERYWPQLVRIWPAYRAFYEQGGERTIFVLEPARDMKMEELGGTSLT